MCVCTLLYVRIEDANAEWLLPVTLAVSQTGIVCTNANYADFANDAASSTSDSTKSSATADHPGTGNSNEKQTPQP